MRTSKYILYTMKSVSKDTDSISYKLMLKAGLIRQSDSGVYIWLPNGIKVLHKIKKIIKHEMNQIGGIEVSFPIIQSDYLWNKSNRFNQYGKELIKLYDRRNKCFILSPTYEEMVTLFIKKEIHSYKKLPIILYQIQTKFRDEIRPRAGIMRAREFIMKDAYSFHDNIDSLKKVYQKMYLAYKKIFKKIGLIFYPVQAESGIMGGKYSHEFQAPAQSGEDTIIIQPNNNNHQNLQTLKNNFFHSQDKNNINKYIYFHEIYKNNQQELKKFFFYMKKKIFKIFIIKIFYKNRFEFICIIIRGDHTLNFDKIKQIEFLKLKKYQFIFANLEEINRIFHKKSKIHFFTPNIIDINILNIKNIIPMTIINNTYLPQYIPIQNFKNCKIYDIVDNYDQKKNKKIKNCIEIGHIFQIGKKYSKNINAKIKSKNGRHEFIHMGCYGIGVSRLISAIIEQNHDERGIIWPIHIAPFQLLIIPINFYKCKKIQEISNNLYNQCKKNNIEVLIDDRNERIGIIFNDANLIGIPNIIIINHHTINNHTIEYQHRKNLKKKKSIKIENIINFLLKTINEKY